MADAKDEPVAVELEPAASFEAPPLLTVEQFTQGLFECWTASEATLIQNANFDILKGRDKMKDTIGTLLDNRLNTRDDLEFKFKSEFDSNMPRPILVF